MIALRRIDKSFGDKKVLDGLSLEVKDGESVAMLGASGSGKSVTLKLILGLEKPDSGEIECGEKKIGMLFQNAALFDSMTVWENVAFSLVNNMHMNADEARRTALQKLADVGLGPEAADLMPSELSGGMKKRVGLARAIADDPKILLFDEPTTGLDPIMSKVINDLILKVVRELHATALTITHDIASAKTIANRIVVLNGGKITWSGKPAELEHTDNRYVREFLGKK
ncbi:MAG: ATP-binding cassette domain-containing protein [Rickettsiales bacterium]|jgi:phospholipid/cholesterol/gamma-HCH transport system ATP-binding protein|nr:ATP-binding cassette domain-containing protein [Rickettsiales bacterium]